MIDAAAPINHANLALAYPIAVFPQDESFMRSSDVTPLLLDVCLWRLEVSNFI